MDRRREDRRREDRRREDRRREDRRREDRFRGAARGCAGPDPHCAGGALAACLTLAALACYCALLKCPAHLLTLLHSPAAQGAAACLGFATGVVFVGLVLRTSFRTVSYPPRPPTSPTSPTSPASPASREEREEREEREDALEETAHRATLLVVACLGSALWYLVAALRAMPWTQPGIGGV